MLTWGHGGHAQLGHEELRSERAPREVEAFRDLRVRLVACGGNWTSAVTGSLLLYTGLSLSFEKPVGTTFRRSPNTVWTGLTGLSIAFLPREYDTVCVVLLGFCCQDCPCGQTRGSVWDPVYIRQPRTHNLSGYTGFQIKSAHCDEACRPAWDFRPCFFLCCCRIERICKQILYSGQFRRRFHAM
jgi:hypothetical protein